MDTYHYYNQRQIYCTGMGVMAPGCKSTSEFYQALQLAKSMMKEKVIDGRRCVGAFLEEQQLEKGYHATIEPYFPKCKKMYQRASKSIQASMQVAAQAWLDAAIPEEYFDGERVGIVIAGSNLTTKYTYDMMAKVDGHFEMIHPRYALDFFDTSHMGYVSEMLDIRGESMSVGGASASGNVAIMKAAQMIQLHIVDVCLVIGTISDFSPIEMAAFKNIGAYGGKSFEGQATLACRPFDKEHEGFLLGEGAGCLILEGEDMARSRKANVYAELVGGAQIVDATRLSDPNTLNQAKTMEKAIASAGLTCNQIDYINTHGTSTPLGDESELKAIEKVMKKHISRVWLNSTKVLFGHCMFSAGVVEAIATILQINGSFIHGMPNLEKPIKEEFCFPLKTEENVNIDYALSNSYGFAGINTSILFKKH